MLDSCHNRNARNPLHEFCDALSVGDNVIVRVSKEEEDDNPDENYFVAKIEEIALRLGEAGTYSAVPFKKNDWIVYVCWYEFVPTKNDRNGDRFYKKGFLNRFHVDQLFGLCLRRLL